MPISRPCTRVVGNCTIIYSDFIQKRLLFSDKNERADCTLVSAHTMTNLHYLGKVSGRFPHYPLPPPSACVCGSGV